MRLFLLNILLLATLQYCHADWTEPVRISEPGGCLYPQIIAWGDTLHVVYENTSVYDKISYLRSTDGGESWSDAEVLSDDSCQTVFPRILRNDNRLMVLWRNVAYYQGPRNWNIAYSISNNNGISWTTPLYVLNPGWEYVLYFSASGNGPVVNVIVSRYIGYDLFFYNVRSTNFGQSWSGPQELFGAAEGGINDQAERAGIIHFVWTGLIAPDEQVEIYYLRSLDGGISWSPHMAISDSDQFHSQLPAIAADDSGNVAVTWMDFKYAPAGATGDIFIRQSPDSGMNWIPESYLTSNHLAVRSDVLVDSDTMQVVWEDESLELSRRKIYYIKSKDNGESWSEPYWIDGTDDDSWNPALAASNGKVYVIWADNRENPGMGLYFTRYEEDVGIEDNRDDILPVNYSLTAYPNPFNSEVAISLNIEKGGDFELTVYDVNGRLVKSLFRGGILEKGTYNLTWDATDNSGDAVSSGVYFAKAMTPQGEKSVKLVLLR